MKKEWYFDQYCGTQFAVLVEDGKLVEFACEGKEGEIVGNIYKGKGENVLTGMQAMFVSCGLERNCYLPIDDTYENASKYDGEVVKTTTNLQVGDEVFVQVVKPPRGNKGAKVTTHISFVGKNLIYLPETEFTGISRKITDEPTREKLLGIAENMKIGKEGYVLRTNSQFATKKQLRSEADYLKKLYRNVKEKCKTAKVGDVLYSDSELSVRIMREMTGDELVHVGNPVLYEKLSSLAKFRDDLSEKNVKLYKGKRAMFREYGIDRYVHETAQPVVSMGNGGYLVIDRTEAMTVVDVNTGSFVGDSTLEDTVFAVNMEASEEIARQVRLRNIGGIVVIDFIDMNLPEHREAVQKKLCECLEKDKAKCNVLPMSELGLVEFTRKRTGSETARYLLKPCDDCKARGYVLSDLFVVTRIRAEIMDKFAVDGYNSVIVELNDGIMKKILSENMLTEDVKTAWKDGRVYMIPHKTFPATQFSVYGDNSGVLNLPDKAQILY